MTLAIDTAKSGPFAGDDVTTVFVVAFDYLDTSHVRVVLTDVNGIETDFVEDTEYTITAPGIGGTVTIKTTPTDFTPATGEKLTIVRDMPFTQLTDYVPNDPFPAETHEDAIDERTMETQQLKEQLERCLIFPVSTSTTDFELPVPAAGELLGWNAAEDAIVNFAAIDLGLETLPATANTYIRRNSGNTAYEARTFTQTWDDIKVSASEAVAGISERATQAETDAGTNDTRHITPLKLAVTLDTVVGSMPRGYIAGLIMSNDTDTAHDIAISVGEARDSANTQDIPLAAILTKQIDVNWVAGDDAGGFPSGLTLSNATWYHMFVIYDTTNALTDAGFDTSLTATNLLADATDYTKFRRIGAVLTDGSANIIQFIQRADSFIWASPPLDVDAALAATTATNYTISVPIGVNVEARVNTYLDEVAVAPQEINLYLRSPDVTDINPSRTAAPLATMVGYSDDNAGSVRNVNLINVWTNTSSQIRATTDAAIDKIRIATVGWSDQRGKDN